MPKQMKSEKPSSTTAANTAAHGAKHPMVAKLTTHEKVMLCLASGCEMEFEPHPTDTGMTIIRPKHPVAITWDGKGYLVMEASKP